MKHHSNPEFLLEAWTTAPNGQNRELYCHGWEPPARRFSERRRAKSQVGYVENFYEIPPAFGFTSGDPQALERQILQRVDTQAAPVHRAIVRERSAEGLSNTDRESWAYLVVSLIHRSPFRVKSRHEGGQAFIASHLEELTRGWTEEARDVLRRRMGADFVRAAGMQTIATALRRLKEGDRLPGPGEDWEPIPRPVTFVLERTWSIEVTSIELLTADDPLVGDPVVGVFALAVSPDLLFVARPPENSLAAANVLARSYNAELIKSPTERLYSRSSLAKATDPYLRELHAEILKPHPRNQGPGLSCGGSVYALGSASS